MSDRFVVVAALVRRALNEITRVPAGAIPGVLAPTIFMIGITAVFGRADELPGFDAPSFRAFVLPVGLLQGAAFAGAATGVNLARDIEQGWFDRLLLSSASRTAILGGIVGSAALRSLMPGTLLLLVGLALGVGFPGVTGLLLAALLVALFAAAVACYAITLAMRFRTQQAAPLMQIGGFLAVLFTTAYAPKVLLQDWLETVATLNPATLVLEGVRQGFVGDVTLGTSLAGLAAVCGLLAVFGTLALRRLGRITD